VVWGNEAVVHYLSGLWPPNRFCDDFPIAQTLDSNSYPSQYRDEFMLSLKKSPPRYILIVENNSPQGQLKKTPRDYLNEFPEFKEHLAGRYQKIDQVDYFAVYEFKF